MRARPTGCARESLCPRSHTVSNRQLLVVLVFRRVSLLLRQSNVVLWIEEMCLRDLNIRVLHSIFESLGHEL